MSIVNQDKIEELNLHIDFLQKKIVEMKDIETWADDAKEKASALKNKFNQELEKAQRELHDLRKL